MKTCTKCEIPKLEKFFSFRNKLEGSLQAVCKDCVRIYDKKSYTSDTRKKSIRKAGKASLDRCKNHVLSIKKIGSCTRCGDKRHYVLDFHHLRDKLFSIAQGVALGLSIKKLQLEIDKCELLCANCHRELHYFNKHSDVHPRTDTA